MKHHQNYPMIVSTLRRGDRGLRLILQSIQIITNRKRFNDSLAPDEQVAFCEK